MLSSIEMNLLPMELWVFRGTKEVIYENNDIDVVAGPGTGKTTVWLLVLKCCLKKLMDLGKESGC